MRICRYVHRHQWTSESHCSSSVSRRKAATQRAYRRLTLVHIVNPCSCARSGTGVIRCTRHRAGRLPPHDPVYRPSGRALHPELPRPSRRKPSHSLGKHPAGRASELQRSFQPEGRQHRKSMQSCAKRRRLSTRPRTGRPFVGLHPPVTSFPGGRAGDFVASQEETQSPARQPRSDDA